MLSQPMVVSSEDRSLRALTAVFRIWCIQPLTSASAEC
jgi:hypothetical protein